MIRTRLTKRFNNMSLRNKIILGICLGVTGLGLLGALVGVIATLGVYLYLAPDLPPVDALKETRLQEPLRVYSRDHRLIAEYGEKRRIPLPIEAIPEIIQLAFLASEDDRFKEHPGVDYQGLLRAAMNQILTGDRSQGGSTITMQVARNFFLSREKTYLRKINEIFLALRIEKELSKDKILELYLNKIYLGRRAYGVAAAARAYYGIGIHELSLAQVAMIAGLPKAPSAFNPVVNPKRALARRNYVLGRMYDLDMISDLEYEEALNTEITARAYDVLAQADAPYVAEMVRAAVVEQYGEDAYTSGMKVYTTLDSRLQIAANSALRNGLLDYEQRHGYKGPAQRLEVPDALDRISIIEEVPVALIAAETEDSATPEAKPLDESPTDPEVSLERADAAEQGITELNYDQQESVFELGQAEADKILKKLGRVGNISPAIVLAFEEITIETPETKEDDEPTEAQPQSSLIAQVYLGEGEFGQLDAEAVAWAKEYISVDKQGSEPESVEDVLALGDVIWLRRTTEGAWVLAQLPSVEGALVSLDPQSGAIVAMIGGFDFFKSKFNRAIQAKRQAGSSFKPFIYSAALENGFTAASIINDAPVVFDDPALEGKWRPENYSGKFFGPTRLREGLVKSRNLVSIRLLISLGISKARRYAKQFGFFDESLPRDLSLVLGSGTVTPLELVTAFSVFANEGYRIKPFFIDRIESSEGQVLSISDYNLACLQCFIDKIDPVELQTQYIVELPVDEADESIQESPEENKTIEDHPAGLTEGAAVAAIQADSSAADENALDGGLSESQAGIGEAVIITEPPKRILRQAEQALDPKVNYIMNSMLRDVIKKGTGVRARALGRNDLAGKTGTTNDQHDAWFSGFNHKYVSTVWVGFDTHQPLGAGEAGSKTALPIWIDYNRVALQAVEEKLPQQPEGVVTIRVDSKTGLLVSGNTNDAIFEIFRAENVPNREVDTTIIAEPFMGSPTGAQEREAEELF